MTWRFRALHLSWFRLRNRLDAIESFLPGRLDDPHTRVSAWIALQRLA